MKHTFDERVMREEQAHEGGSVLEESYKLKDKFHHIWGYPSRKRVEEYKGELLNNLTGKDVLDYGCGWGANSLKYYLSGANVTGIDISERFINTANKEFCSKKLDVARYEFLKMDAHKLLFENRSFDYVVGDGILHHLDAEIALREIYRVLKPDGKVILFEPLADHPLLKLFRLLTPKARTIDETPIKGSDLHSYSKINDWSSEHRFCGILESPIAIVTSILMPTRPENFLLKMTDIVEKKMIEKQFLLSWNQYVLLVFKK